MNTKFKIGVIPWNKNTKGVMKPNATSFKKGQIPYNKKINLEKICICGNIFYVKQSLARIKCCSRSCSTKGRNLGSKHWNWKEDRNTLKKDRLQAYDVQYRNWMKQVKNRDYWNCRISNDNCSGRVEAHHILPWRDYPELRYQINNGITLCHFHHPRKREDEKRLQSEFQALVSVSSAIL